MLYSTYKFVAIDKRGMGWRVRCMGGVGMGVEMGVSAKLYLGGSLGAGGGVIRLVVHRTLKTTKQPLCAVMN